MGRSNIRIFNIITMIDTFIKIWPILTTLFGGLIAIAHFLIRLHIRMGRQEDKHTSDIELIKSEHKAELDLLKQRVATTEMVIDHLTRAGENIKDELSATRVKIMQIDTKLEHIIALLTNK